MSVLPVRGLLTADDRSVDALWLRQITPLLSRLPVIVAIDAARTVAGRIERIVDHSIDDRRQVTGDAHDQPAPGEFIGPEVDLATLPDVHRRCPLPAVAQQVGLDRLPIDPGTGVGAAPL